MLTGTAGTGAACVNNLDCAGYCAPTGAIGGTCAPAAKSGEGCSAASCVAGLTCRSTCLPPLDEFEHCDNRGQCRSASCMQPCVVSGSDGKGKPIVENRFCPMGCNPSGACIIGSGLNGPIFSTLDRCAPLQTARALLCTPPPTM